MTKHVTIPLVLLERTIDVLDCLEPESLQYGPVTRFDYDTVLWALKLKKRGTLSRRAYRLLIEYALSQEALEEARQQALDQRTAAWDACFDDEPF